MKEAIGGLLFLLLLQGEGGSTLRIQSQPDVQVLWEGVDLGTTDDAGVLTIADIPPGEYRIELRRPGFESESIRMEVEPGENVLNLELQEPPAPPPSPAPPQATESPPQELPGGPSYSGRSLTVSHRLLPGRETDRPS